MQIDREAVIEAARFAGAAKFYPEAQSVKEQNYIVSERFLERYAQVIAQRAVEADRAQAVQIITGPCGQCKDSRQPCHCAIDTMLSERGSVAVNREHYLSLAKQAKAAQERKPLTDEQIREWWASENGLEDCDMGKLVDFTAVVREVEAKLSIEPIP